MPATTGIRIIGVLFLLAALTSTSSGQSFQSAMRIRRPVAVECVNDVLYVANQRSGSISVVSPADGRVVNELELGKSIVDLECSCNGERFWAIDSEMGQLIEVTRSSLRFNVIRRHLPASPVSLLLAPNEGVLSVACLWPRKLVLLVTDEQGQIADSRELSLPFSPREQLYLNNNHLLVADAFAGRVAIVDVSQSAIIAVHDSGGQNIRGLALSKDHDRVQLTMQRLNSFRPTTHEDVFWGGVLQNLMVEVAVTDLLNKDLDWYAALQDYYLGRPNEAAGDPDAMVTLSDGRTLVALAGVHQIALRPAPDAPFELRHVGARPVDIAVDGKRERAFVACQMDDSIAVIDLASLSVVNQIPLGPDTPDSNEARGEALFYDATLSLDGWYSCHSCHTDGHSTGQLNDNFGDNSTGAPKRVLSLLGTADTGPWTWTGGATSLEQQVQKSLENTMQASTTSEEVVRALAAYLRTLPPPPAGHVRWTVDPAAIDRGATVFRNHGCAECHQPPSFTTPERYDVGVHDQVDNKKFNPPSLRGVAHRDAFFHDNRAGSLEEVFSKFHHPESEQLNAEELEDLLTYLRSL